MADDDSGARVHLYAGDAPDPGAAQLRTIDDQPFCIAVLGDFSGRGADGSSAADAPDWRATRVTPDNAIELAGLRPGLELRLAGGPSEPIEIEFRSLDDFHPDSLYRTLPLFGELRDARLAVKEGRETEFTLAGAIADEADEPDAAAGRSSGGEPGESSGEGPAEAPRVPAEGLLEAILDEAPSVRPTEAAGPDPELAAFVRSIVRPHLVRPGPDRTEELAAIDRAASALMRMVIHHADVQALESLWRSVVFLLSRTDSSNKVRVHLVDVSKAELARDLLRAEDGTRSRLYSLLAAPDLGPAADRWALVIGAYTFGESPDDAAFVSRIAEVAGALQVPWISGADSRLAGCESLSETSEPRDWAAAWTREWADVPSSPGATCLGLALPRFLVREPYGPESARRCKAFSFHEDGDDSEGQRTVRRDLLWANPAFLCGVLLGQAFAQRGWGFATDSVLDVGQVPIAASGTPADPAPVLTEHRLTRAAASRLAEVGLMPVVAFPYEARLRVPGIRPVATPPAALGAWWNA